MQRVINFSGGKTSAFMTIKHYRPGDVVLFTDTGREHPKTYKFINDFEAFEGIPVIRVKYYDSERPFFEMLKRRKFSAIPNRAKRFCTIELKVKTAKRYLRSIGVQHFEQLTGFRADEKERVERHVERFKKVKTIFPLYSDGITKQDINEYWKHKPYNLEIPSILGNCTLCFMKGQNAVMAILREFPELAEEWIKDERDSDRFGPINKKGEGRTYFPGITIEQLRNTAQNNLFKDYDLNEISPAYNCACGP